MRTRTWLGPVLTAATVLVLAAPAHADRLYGGLGVGPGARLGGDFGTLFNSDGEVGGRFFAGYRFGPWSVEGSLFGTDMYRPADPYSTYSTTSFGLSGKYNLELGHSIELYVRLGLDHTSLNAPGRADGTAGTYHDFSGIGLDYGTGVQWLSHPLGSGRVQPRIGGMLDLGVQRTSITRSNANRDISGSLDLITACFVAAVDL